jgi:ATP-binding cassette subfamily C protein
MVALISDTQRIHSLPIVNDLYRDYSLSEHEVLILLSLAILLFVLGKNAFLFATARVRARLVNDCIAEVGTKLLAHYLSLDYPEFISRNSADYIRNVQISVRASFNTVFTGYIEIATEALVVCGIAAILVAAEPVTALIAVVVLGATFAATYSSIARRMQTLGDARHDLDRAILLSLNQSLGGFRDIRVLGRVRHVLGVFQRLIGAYAENLRLNTVLNATPRLVFDTIVPGGFLLVVVVLLLRGYAQGEIVPLLGLFAMSAVRLLPSCNRILAAANNVKGGRASVAEIHRDLAAFRDRPIHPSERGAVSKLAFRDRIRLEDVCYRYKGETAADAISDVTVEIQRGESVGIVGPSGAGKSTLADILLGLLAPMRGRLLIDGRDVGPDIASWQQLIGFVPQQIHLIDDTIRRNIAVGFDDAEIDGAALDEAVDLARLDSVVNQLPAGLHTVIGERGVRLSGGQRQRIGIARALYRRPEVLVLDEATSSLDMETESEVNDAIERLSGRITVIVIAHRLSTVRRCHRILFMREGRIIDSGSFSELTARNPEFRQLVRLSDVGGADNGDLPAGDPISAGPETIRIG